MRKNRKQDAEVLRFFITFVLDRGNSFRTYEKKRYAYLEVGNVGNSRLFREKGVMVLTL